MTLLYKNIGFKLRKLRETVPLSQETMAIELGISQGALSKIENGFVEKIDVVLMDKICKLLKVDLQDLLSDSFSQTNQDNKNSAISIFGNPIVNNHFPENIIETILNNQTQIALSLENQNKLLAKLLENM